MKKVLIVLFGIVFLFIAAILVGHFIGYDFVTRGFLIVRSDEPIGVESPSGKYRLVELTDQTGQYLLYSIVQLGGVDDNLYPRTVFVTDDFWYHSRYISGAGWLDESDNFYIESTDTGTHVYLYQDGTWYCAFNHTD